MKTKRFFYTLAASVMLAATAGLLGACTDNIDNSVSPDGKHYWGTQILPLKIGDMELKYKFVEGGAYSMQYERDGETKTVTGTLSDYYISPVEVSNKLWAMVMGQKPEGQTNDGDMYPVTMVNYYDIAGPGGFLEKLNAMLKDQLPVGKKFALPTEAQWQYAAMGGKQSKGYKYSGSNTLDDVAWYKDNAGGTTHPVGQKQPNELGLYDMSGNVWEYSSDWYAELTDLPAEQGTDYAGPAKGEYIICNGGCYKSEASSVAIIHHGKEGDGEHNVPFPVLGFRLVLAAPSDNYSTPQPIAVDLGLPSGTKWANMNVGASKPEDYGNFYAWGETTGYSSSNASDHTFNWANYALCNGSSTTLKKYNNNESYGTVDNKTTLEPADDAATQAWGSAWCMPTAIQWNELLSEYPYTSTTGQKRCWWGTYNSVNGLVFYDASDNVVLFLPAAGHRYDSSLGYQGSEGDYWSSSLRTSLAPYGQDFFFYSGDAFMSSSRRYYGRSVRPVSAQ